MRHECREDFLVLMLFIALGCGYGQWMGCGILKCIMMIIIIVISVFCDVIMYSWNAGCHWRSCTTGQPSLSSTSGRNCAKLV